MSNYLLSIIIPTKNRQKYCIAAIKQILSIGNYNLQIVIQDNSDSKELKTYIDKLNCKNIVYNYHLGELSFVDNFSEALLFAKGEYLCMIGDDDGILPNIIDVTNFAKTNGYDAIIPGLNAVYCWPNEKTFIKNAENGYLCISYLKNFYKSVNVSKGLEKLLKNGGQDYQNCDIPRLYHGLVSRNKINEIFKITGKYFDGLTPDIYIATALSFVCKKVCRYYFPITVSGICPTSGSSDSATGKHTGKLEDAPHFRGHSNYQWDNKVPRIYSVESIWAETVLKALLNFSRQDLYDKFNITMLASICFIKYPQYKEEIKNFIETNRLNILKIQFQTIKIKYLSVIKKAVKKVFRKKGAVKKFYNVKSIFEAVKITSDELKNKINYENC